MKIKSIISGIVTTMRDIVEVCTTNGNEISKKGGTIEFVSPNLEKEINRQKKRYPFLKWCHEQKKMSALHVAETSEAKLAELRWFYDTEMTAIARQRYLLKKLQRQEASNEA